MIERIYQGEIPAKHHTALRSSTGEIRYEECLTRDGFDGPYSILYHINRPQLHRLSDDAVGFEIADAVSGTRLAKQHFVSGNLPPRSGAPIECRQQLLLNDDVVFSVLTPTADDPCYFNNADADDLYFIVEGGGTLHSPMGALAFGANDYVVVPKGVIHRFALDPGVKQKWLSIECLGGIRIPKQWRNPVGQLRMDAPYCHRDFRGPVFSGPKDCDLRGLTVKRDNRFHGFELLSSPLDVVGWDGTVYPFVFPILKFQPRVGMVHLPPDWHGTFATRGAIICSFVPRKVDFHPDAIPCPYPHTAVDCDEVLYYISGNFTSRKGVGSGSISLHPVGVPHGPHPGAYEASMGSTETNEFAVMMDTFKPLRPTALALSVVDSNYTDSFNG